MSYFASIFFSFFLQAASEKMERDEGLRTLECLRGRLLAERQASKTAKEDAELMGNKVIELEKKLKEETKVINKAEKRLKLLSKKLESLKLVPSLEESEHPAAVSCVSSTSSSEKVLFLHLKTPVLNQVQSMKIQRLMTQGQALQA
ncbi:hypothetical protein V6Z12_D09G180700 [Gossypium hirsutum]